MNIFIVGAGALGSHLVPFIRNLDATITLMDFDRVETKNVRSQWHARGSVRQNKATSVMRSMHRDFGVAINVNEYELTPKRLSLLDEQDLVVDAVDNIASRQLIADHCRELDIPCLHGGLSADGTLARVVWNEHWVGDAEDSPGQPTCEDQDALPFIGLAAAALALEVQRFVLTGEQISSEIGTRCYHRIA